MKNLFFALRQVKLGERMHKSLPRDCSRGLWDLAILAWGIGMKSVEEVLSVLDAFLIPDGLSNLQELIVRGCWEGKTYTQIAEAID
jgi:hypothetical protein